MESSSSGSREKMLARIGSALNRDALIEPEPLRPFALRAVEVNVGELLERFIAELEQVGGRVARVSSRGEVQEYLKGLLPPDERATVALSDALEVREARLREFLDGLGVRLVPTWQEFAAARGLSDGTTSTQSSPDDGAGGELFEQYKHALIEADIGVTSADYALAETGTLVLMSGMEQHRLISLLPPVHVCLLNPKRIMWGLTELLARVEGRFSESESTQQMMTCITGPSRTADIEQTITTGVHGPKWLHVLLYEVDEGNRRSA